MGIKKSKCCAFEHMTESIKHITQILINNFINNDRDNENHEFHGAKKYEWVEVIVVSCIRK